MPAAVPAEKRADPTTTQEADPASYFMTVALLSLVLPSANATYILLLAEMVKLRSYAAAVENPFAPTGFHCAPSHCLTHALSLLPWSRKATKILLLVSMRICVFHAVPTERLPAGPTNTQAGFASVVSYFMTVARSPFATSVNATYGVPSVPIAMLVNATAPAVNPDVPTVDQESELAEYCFTVALLEFAASL
jgi:hypothetical protein